MNHGLGAWLAGAACAALPCSVLAWGDDGHRIVGLIAAHYLEPGVQQAVDALLAGDTTGLVPAKDMANEATWADKYRDSDRNSTKQRYNQTHFWHYVDLALDTPDLDAACNHHPPVPAGTPASAAEPNDCVVDKIDQFSAELADAATPVAERRMALQFLLHFVGDLHQPLHASDDNDQGGNAKKTHGPGTSDNLHSSWDTPFVTALGAGDAAIADALVAAITPAQRAQWSRGAAADWAREAWQIAKTQAYGKLPAPAADHSYTLGAAYVDAAHSAVRQQLSRAGVRLAWVLNIALAQGTPPPPPPPPPAGSQLLSNPGFEDGASRPGAWTTTAGVLSDDPAEPAHGGTWVAWLDGYGEATTDRLHQTVTLPADATGATLAFWLHIDSDETTRVTAYDTLTVQVQDTRGRALKTLATYSNLDAADGWRQVSFDLGAYRGRTIRVSFTGREDGSKQTSFVLDDLSLESRP